jgi:hypothetical protein
MENINNNLPKFVRLNHTAFRLVGNRYYRDAGDWWIGYKVIGGKLFSDIIFISELNNLPLISISREEYFEDNKGYIPDDI